MMNHGRRCLRQFSGRRHGDPAEVERLHPVIIAGTRNVSRENCGRSIPPTRPQGTAGTGSIVLGEKEKRTTEITEDTEKKRSPEPEAGDVEVFCSIPFFLSVSSVISVVIQELRGTT